MFHYYTFLSKQRSMKFLLILGILCFFVNLECCLAITSGQKLIYREKVRSMFNFAYNNYLTKGFPHDEVSPMSCTGKDTWGSYSLSLVDALSTLAVKKKKKK